MTTKFQPLRGTKDLLPEDYKVHEYIINQAKSVGILYGYQPISTPIIEYTGVFNRSMGKTSDVVSKEIYGFLDKSNEPIALRPEFTAGIMRAFISNGLQQNLPLRLFSHGPVFRYDRPQMGRQRQFYQINFEHLGAETPYSDAEIIKLAVDILNRLEIGKDVALELNSLGCTESRALYQQKLVQYLNDYKDQLSEDSAKRLLKNPMRILDSKDENDQKIVKNGPIISDYYSDNSKKYFEELLCHLDSLNIKYIINPRLVRGLDYYCHTAFEFTTTKLGSQSTILAGGRYDGLSKLMGGPNVSAIGFAAGIERLALMREYNTERSRIVYIFPVEENNLSYSIMVADRMRQENIPIIIDSFGKISKRIQRAIAKNASYVIFIGDAEQADNNLKLKNLDKQEEYLLSINAAINLLK